MPSFDIVSKFNLPELINAIDQANREVAVRYDFKNSGANFALNKENDKINLTAPSKFQIEQMLAILQAKLAKRGIDIAYLEIGKTQESLHKATMEIVLKQGLSQEFAKSVIKSIKDLNLKIQASILSDQIRVTGKNRDDLQTVITHLRQAKLAQPLQYENFRD